MSKTDFNLLSGYQFTGYYIIRLVISGYQYGCWKLSCKVKLEAASPYLGERVMADGLPSVTRSFTVRDCSRVEGSPYTKKSA